MASATVFEVTHRLWDEPLRDGPWAPEIAELMWGQWYAAVLAANCRVPSVDWHFRVERVEVEVPRGAEVRRDLESADTLYSVTLRPVWSQVREKFNLGPSPAC